LPSEFLLALGNIGDIHQTRNNNLFQRYTPSLLSANGSNLLCKNFD
jgi:hypothetical protein